MAKVENKEPTEYELLTEEIRQCKFHGNKSRYDFANYEIRKSRARLMMMDWMVLFDESFPLELGSTDSLTAEATQMLISFKKHLTKDTEAVQRIGKLVGNLESLLIKAGEVERNCTLLTNDLRSQLADKTRSIGEYSSLCGIVRSFLSKANQIHEKKHAISDIICKKFAHQIVRKVIDLLAADTEIGLVPYIAKVKSTDNDIYLNKDWTSAVSTYLEHMPWDKMVKYLELSKKSSSNVEEIEKLPWENIVKYLIESKKNGSNLDAISDKILRIIKIKSSMLLSKSAGSEETQVTTPDEDAGDFKEKQTLSI
ncbi:hypothetical protein TUM19329_10830 [Legionella antarctica]|uniref:Uncharacterized protein n=1 Tax=Legionella antarctica TaxID=2708020 RepID=A0A6F8T3X3_9GAMM|nr:hypothetical protein [Legionella antarctica]BCA94722.1 hypothetical protein TUM19329_10830 [Legionella antarctica]